MRTLKAFLTAAAVAVVAFTFATFPTLSFADECKTKSIEDVALYVTGMGFKVVDVTELKGPLLAKMGLVADPNETMLVAAIGENLGVLIFADKDGCITATAKGHPDRLRGAIEAAAGTGI